MADTQLSVSAVIYCFVIFSLFGAVSWALKSVSSVIPVLPLKLDQKYVSACPSHTDSEAFNLGPL